jgi:hypothetical protein
MCTFPALVSDLISIFTQASDQTLLDMANTIIVPEDVRLDRDKYTVSCLKYFQKFFNARLTGTIKFKSPDTEETIETGEVAAGNIEQLWNSVVNYAAQNESEVRGIFPHFFSSIFIGAWAVFETLASDLWINSLDAHPKGLAKLEGRWPETVERDKYKKENEARLQKTLVDVVPQPLPDESINNKALKLSVLETYSYDVSGKMGTILSERFSFQSLNSIRDAYFKAFSEGHHEIQRIMLSVDIRAVCAMRNVLVHNAGVADGDFVGNVKGIPRFERVEEKKPVVIDGTLVTEFVYPFIDNCDKLIKEVDGWIQAR